jgi:RNA polymerase sigma factor (sigma-70 family)
MEQHSRQRYEDYKSFMRRHQEAVWRVCYDFAHGDIPRCEDMVQEVWIMLWLKFDAMTSRTEWQQRVWVRRVTRSVLVDLYRKNKFNPLSNASDLSKHSDLSDTTDNADLAERIDDLFAALIPDEQHLMRLRLEGYSAEEIAAELKIEPNAVYQRVNRIMNKLRAYATRL